MSHYDSSAFDAEGGSMKLTQQNNEQTENNEPTVSYILSQAPWIHWHAEMILSLMVCPLSFDRPSQAYGLFVSLRVSYFM
jgi:hypothetical protein